MFEYHVWLVVQPSPGDSEHADERAAFDHAASLLHELEEPGLTDLRQVNGQIHLTLGGYANRQNLGTRRALEVVTEIAEHSPGTYGTVFLHDDEDPELGNRFRVLVVSRGRVVEHEDPFLSPVIPTIEDP